MKWLNRFRKRLARKVEPAPLWGRKTHTAYPEIQADVNGVWVLRFYAYEPIGWLFGEQRYEVCPKFPEPTEPHPTQFPDGQAPSASLVAWAKHYRERPQPIVLIEEISGRASSKAKALAAAQKVMYASLDKYRRSV